MRTPVGLQPYDMPVSNPTTCPSPTLDLPVSNPYDLPDARHAHAVVPSRGTDYISIPQTVGLQDKAETQAALAQQAAAIKSIPSYVSRANNFFVCAPSNARHVDGGFVADFLTWRERGWCRLEEGILMIERIGDGRPLIIDSPYGEAPKARSLDMIDRLIVGCQRKTAVLTGEYSCCRLGHRLEANDGSVLTVPCDKVMLSKVIRGVLNRKLAQLSTTMRADPNALEGSIMDVIRKSMQSDMGFFNMMMLQVCPPLLTALGMPSPSYLPWYAPPSYRPWFFNMMMLQGRLMEILATTLDEVCPPRPTSLGMPSPSHLPWCHVAAGLRRRWLVQAV